MRRIIFPLILCVFFTPSAWATWSPITTVEKLNPGGNGLHGTFISLQGATFSGCVVTTWAWIDGAGANYKEIMASLLAAKMADRQVQVGYSGCNGNYPIVTEIVVP